MAFSLVADDFSPVLQGDTLQPLSVQFATYINGTPAAYDLSGLTLSLKLQSANDESIVINGTGLWTIDDASGGLAHYQYNTADVATPGVWLLFIKLTNSGTGAFVHALTKALQVLAAP